MTGLKERLAAGDRIRLVQMGDDPNPIEPGAEGTVTFVSEFGDGTHQIGVAWDNKRTLSLVETDKWEKISG